MIKVPTIHPYQADPRLQTLARAIARKRGCRCLYQDSHDLDTATWYPDTVIGRVLVIGTVALRGRPEASDHYAVSEASS